MLDPNKPSKWWIIAVNIWKSYVCTAVEETYLESIPPAKNTTELVVKTRPEKRITFSWPRWQIAPHTWSAFPQISSFQNAKLFPCKSALHVGVQSKLEMHSTAGYSYDITNLKRVRLSVKHRRGCPYLKPRRVVQTLKVRCWATGTQNIRVRSICVSLSLLKPERKKLTEGKSISVCDSKDKNFTRSSLTSN